MRKPVCGVMKDEELKLEEIEASHILGGAGSLREMLPYCHANLNTSVYLDYVSLGCDNRYTCLHAFKREVCSY
jgi:hypothetical protein